MSRNKRRREKLESYIVDETTNLSSESSPKRAFFQVSKEHFSRFLYPNPGISHFMHEHIKLELMMKKIKMQPEL